jgi:hypothetical protein
MLKSEIFGGMKGVERMFGLSSKDDGALGYFVSAQDWPVGTDQDSLSSEEVIATLGDMSKFHDVAMSSLGSTESDPA